MSVLVVKQTLQKEIQGHQPRIDEIHRRGEAQSQVDGERQSLLKDRLVELRDLWDQLIAETDKRRDRLIEANRAQQFYADAAEAEAWMGEQELHMMSEEKAKDEQSALAMVKKHQILEQALEDYAQTIHQLANSSRLMVDKLYAGLKDLAEERSGRLQESLRLTQLKREVDDLEQWIAEREVVAGSHELGQDYEHVTFARDTSNIGQERVDGVNGLADDLIESGHPENASVAEWKDGLNEAWADLLELIDTRTQMLAASYELHKFHQDAMEVLGRIKEKKETVPSDLGRDLNTVQHLYRQHNTFENDIQALSGQDDAARLQKAYAGEKADDIHRSETAVTSAWQVLLEACKSRRLLLLDTVEKFRFLNMVRDLMLWMDGIHVQIDAHESPSSRSTRCRGGRRKKREHGDPLLLRLEKRWRSLRQRVNHMILQPGRAKRVFLKKQRAKPNLFSSSHIIHLLFKHRTSLDQTTLNQSVSVNGVHSDNDTSQGSESESVNGPGRDSGLASSRFEQSVTLPSRAGADSEPDTMEGILCRKQEMESHNKKAAT
ncbi:Spectrin beta chain, non-erythrocytic 1, partial [Goodea atripinnis]